MCGIIGFAGRDQAAPILLDGLERMEYRGYDSAGVAVYSEKNQALTVCKAKGRLQVLSDLIQGGAAVDGTVGIGHTRWATHGAPSDANSHPQVSQNGKIAVVHNGIIENYVELKQFLIRILTGQNPPLPRRYSVRSKLAIKTESFPLPRSAGSVVRNFVLHGYLHLVCTVKKAVKLHALLACSFTDK